MASIYWYCLLAVTGVTITAYIIYKNRDIKFFDYIVFFLLATCVTWIGEFVVLGIFDSYAYKTGIFTNPWAQNLLGHLILNTTFYPGTAILVAVYSLGYGWISLITVFYLLLEFLFLKLGIYEHHWWKYYMTALAIFIYLIINKQWFKRAIKTNNLSHKLRTSTFYFVGFVIIHFPIPILLLLGKQHYDVNIVDDLYLSSIIFIFIYQLFESLLLVFFVCILNKWFWKLVPFIIAYIGQGILLNMKILVFQEGWNLLYTMILYFLSIAAFILLEKYSLNSSCRVLK